MQQRCVMPTRDQWCRSDFTQDAELAQLDAWVLRDFAEAQLAKGTLWPREASAIQRSLAKRYKEARIAMGMNE